MGLLIVLILVKPDVFVGIAQPFEVSLEVLEGDDNGAATVVGMERERLVLGLTVVMIVEERGIEKEMHMMSLVIDEAKRRYTARLKP